MQGDTKSERAHTGAMYQDANCNINTPFADVVTGLYHMDIIICAKLSVRYSYHLTGEISLVHLTTVS